MKIFAITKEESLRPDTTHRVDSSKIAMVLCACLALFMVAGRLLQQIDLTAAVLDIGILSVLLFGILVAVAAVFCSIWLSEVLWKPFKAFRSSFDSLFTQLNPWQQCIIYFSVFFLSLYACLQALAIVL